MNSAQDLVIRLRSLAADMADTAYMLDKDRGVDLLTEADRLRKMADRIEAWTEKR